MQNVARILAVGGVLAIPALAFGAASFTLTGGGTGISGTTAIVGADKDTDDGYSGAAYVFQDTGSGWNQVAKLQPDGQGNAFFGYSVSISGTTAIVGARWDDDSGIRTGAAIHGPHIAGQKTPSPPRARTTGGTSAAVRSASAWARRLGSTTIKANSPDAALPPWMRRAAEWRSGRPSA